MSVVFITLYVIESFKELNKLKIPELNVLCKKNKIKGFSYLKKNEKMLKIFFSNNKIYKLYFKKETKYVLKQKLFINRK